MGNKLKTFMLLNIGAFLDAAGFYYFFSPNQIAPGGINGLSLVINSYYPHVSLGLLVMVMSIILLIIGFITVGPFFGLKTIYCSLIIPLIIWVMEHYFPIYSSLSQDMLIQLIFGVLISGTGLAILFNQNASTGGTDILARIINKYYHLNMGKGLFLIDSLVTIIAGRIFGITKGMYSLLGVILYTFVIDYIIEGLNVSKHVTIITTASQPVKQFIVEELGRGATLYTARGAFTEEEREVVVTVLNRREFIRLRNFIKVLDPAAFITVQNVHEVLGEGFSTIE